MISSEQHSVSCKKSTNVEETDKKDQGIGVYPTDLICSGILWEAVTVI